MNPDRIYQEHRDDAMAKQFEAAEYSTFVAMPFREQFSYRSRDVKKEIIEAAAKYATEHGDLSKPFATPKRIDEKELQAGVITEEIIVQILESHLFVGDLTFENPGVLLETGIALGLKPNGRIILMVQGERDLHFDIRNNNIIDYNAKDSTKAEEEIGKAFIAAARHWESDAEKAISQRIENLTPEALTCLLYYDTIQGESEKNSLHSQQMPDELVNMWGDVTAARCAYGLAIRELIENRLMYTQFRPQPTVATPNRSKYGNHATALGWAVIKHLRSQPNSPVEE